MKQNILITRPNDQAQELKKYLLNNNLEVFVEPIFSVQNLLCDEKTLEKIKQKNFKGIVVTSLNATKNAFKVISDLNFDKQIKVFAVGKKTAQIFKEQGYENVFYPKQESALNLKNLIVENSKNLENLLYFCGEVITLDFQQELKEYDISVEKIVSYKIINQEFFSENFLQEVKKINFDFVLLYSKNSALKFFELLEKQELKDNFRNTKFLCLSEKILLFVKKLGYKNSTTFAENPILKKFYD